jgi:hypothetical protein
MDRWAKGVQLGAAAARRDAATRWDYGDALLASIGQPSRRGVSNGDHERIERWRHEVAEAAKVDIDFLPTHNTLTHYRVAAFTFPPEHREGLPIFAAHEIACAWDRGDIADRFAFVERVRRDDGRVRVDDVRKALGRMTTRVPSEGPATPRQTAAALADPEVVHELASSPEGRRAVEAAYDALPAPAPPPLPDSHRVPQPEPAAPTAGDYLAEPAPDPSDYEVDHLIARAAREMRTARDRVRQYGLRTRRDIAATRDLMDALVDDAAEVMAAVHAAAGQEVPK